MDNGTRDTVLEAGSVKARLAKVYAEALLAAATQAHAADAVGADLAAFVRDVLNAAPDIEAFLGSPVVGRKTKTAALEAALPGHLSDLLRGLLATLARNGRLDLIRGIATVYHQLIDRRAGRVPVKVTAAAELTDAQRAALDQTLTGMMKGQPVLNVRVDPDLIGGLVVQIGDRVIDTSVRTRLRSLRNRLMETAEGQ
jgi:F-type H+-transporting ATPase subunit delta